MQLLGVMMASVIQTGLSWFARTKLAQVDGKLQLQGLRAPVEVIRDRWGVPHIYASNVPDALFAQGFVHAQDRLWQMEFNRRLVAGRLAEVLGATPLPVDRWMRILGMRRVAEAEVALLRPDVRAEVDAYVAGINAFIARGKLPIEFTLLRYRPEPWRVADSLSWAKMMSWSLSINWETEMLRAQLIARLGPSALPSWSRRRSTVSDHRCQRTSAGLADLGRSGAGSRRGGATIHRPIGAGGPGEQQLGHRRLTHDQRQAAAGERHAPADDHPGRLVRKSSGQPPRAGCRVPTWTSPASPSLASPTWSPDTTRTSPGASPTASPTCRTSTWSTCAGQRTAACRSNFGESGSTRRCSRRKCA